MLLMIKVLLVLGLLSSEVSYAHKSISEPKQRKNFQAKTYGWDASTIHPNRIFIPLETPRVILVQPMWNRPHHGSTFRGRQELHRHLDRHPHRQHTRRY
jgi:hypothetical protein